jgi:virulence factor Mce-like protein
MVDQGQSRPQRKTPLEERNKFLLGSIAIAVLIAIIATMLLVQRAAPGYRTINAEFAQASGLQPKYGVTVSGIQVGNVTGMKLAGDRVDVKMRVRNDIKLGKDSRARIMVTTILGGRYVALTPGGGGPLPDNTIDLKHTDVPYDLQEALHDMTVSYESVNTDNIAKALDALGNQIKGLPPVVPQAMKNLETLSTIMADRRDQFGSMLKTLQTVSTTLKRQQTSIGNLVRQGNDLFGEFVARRASFTAMMDSVTELVGTLDGIVVEDRAELEKLLDDVNGLADLLGKHDDLLRSTLQAAPVGLRGLTNALGSGNSGDLAVANGLLIDSWMCAIASGRAKQVNRIQYFKDCK